MCDELLNETLFLGPNLHRKGMHEEQVPDISGARIRHMKIRRRSNAQP